MKLRKQIINDDIKSNEFNINSHDVSCFDKLKKIQGKLFNLKKLRICVYDFIIISNIINGSFNKACYYQFNNQTIRNNLLARPYKSCHSSMYFTLFRKRLKI